MCWFILNVSLWKGIWNFLLKYLNFDKGKKKNNNTIKVRKAGWLAPDFKVVAVFFAPAEETQSYFERLNTFLNFIVLLRFFSFIVLH